MTHIIDFTCTCKMNKKATYVDVDNFSRIFTQISKSTSNTDVNRYFSAAGCYVFCDSCVNVIGCRNNKPSYKTPQNTPFLKEKFDLIKILTDKKREVNRKRREKNKELNNFIKSDSLNEKTEEYEKEIAKKVDEYIKEEKVVSLTGDDKKDFFKIPSVLHKIFQFVSKDGLSFLLFTTKFMREEYLTNYTQCPFTFNIKIFSKNFLNKTRIFREYDPLHTKFLHYIYSNGSYELEKISMFSSPIAEINYFFEYSKYVKAFIKGTKRNLSLLQNRGRVFDDFSDSDGDADANDENFTSDSENSEKKEIFDLIDYVEERFKAIFSIKKASEIQNEFRDLTEKEINFFKKFNLSSFFFKKFGRLSRVPSPELCIEREFICFFSKDKTYTVNKFLSDDILQGILHTKDNVIVDCVKTVILKISPEIAKIYEFSLFETARKKDIKDIDFLRIYLKTVMSEHVSKKVRIKNFIEMFSK